MDIRSTAFINSANIHDQKYTDLLLVSRKQAGKMTVHLRLPTRKLLRTVVAAVLLIVLYNIYLLRPGHLIWDEEKPAKRDISPSAMSSNFNITKGSKKVPSAMEESVPLNNMTEFWNLTGNLLGKNELYPADFNVNVVINKMATSKIETVTKAKGGTSFKWVFRLDGGQNVLFKPQLIKPGTEKKVYCNAGHEQPRYEIAAFHLLRLLDWRTVPFVAGRKVNITSEILPFASTTVKDSIKTLDNGTVCVVEKCYYCEKEHSDCFQDGVIDGSLMFWLHQPIRHFSGLGSQYHPFHPMANNKTVFKFGLNDHRHCDYVRTKHQLYKDPHYFLDLVDIAIMDYLLMNEDQKHVCIVEGRVQPVMTVHIDHGLAFCEAEVFKPTRVLAVLSQCCRVRESTIAILKKRLPTLKEDFSRVTLGDQLYPLLTDSQLDKLTQRIGDVLKTVSECEAVVNKSELYDTTN